MGFDRSEGDKQSLRDLIIGHALGDMLQDLDLPRREGVQPSDFPVIVGSVSEFCDEAFGDTRLDQGSAVLDCVDGSNEIVGRRVFEEEAAGATA